MTIFFKEWRVFTHTSPWYLSLFRFPFHQIQMAGLQGTCRWTAFSRLDSRTLHKSMRSSQGRMPPGYLLQLLLYSQCKQVGHFLMLISRICRNISPFSDYDKMNGPQQTACFAKGMQNYTFSALNSACAFEHYCLLLTWCQITVHHGGFITFWKRPI